MHGLDIRRDASLNYYVSEEDSFYSPPLFQKKIIWWSLLEETDFQAY